MSGAGSAIILSELSFELAPDYCDRSHSMLSEIKQSKVGLATKVLCHTDFESDSSGFPSIIYV